MSQISGSTAGGGGGAGTVTSVTGGNNITITGNPAITPTVNVSGTTNFAVQIGNATGSLTSVALGTAGQVLTSNGAGVAPTFQAGGGGGLTTIAGDTGSTTGPVVTFDGDTNSGATVLFTVAGTTVSFNVTDASDNTYMGLNSGNPTGGGTTTGNTAFGSGALLAINNNSGGFNTVFGATAGQGIILSSFNTFVGYAAANIVEGDNNTFIGASSGNFGADQLTENTCVGAGAGSGLPDLSTGNVSLGYNALVGPVPAVGATVPTNNVAIGTNALSMSLVVPTDSIGSYNVAIGANAGSTLTGAEASNIYINNLGVATESHALRIGAGTGTGNQQLNKTFIHGIFGITTGVSGIPVVVDNAGQLGTVVSSKRYKKNIVDMADTKILSLRPVNFTYKADKSNKTQYGLIAEEVEKVMPDLVVYSLEGQIESVKYQDLSVLLLKEMQKLKADVEELKARV